MANKPVIAKPIPLDQVDPDRQREYGGLTTAPATISVDSLEEKPPEPLDEDKKEFVRAILGNVPFGKTYVIYGSIKVSFLTRAVMITEKLYEELRGMPTVKTKEEWELWERRFKLLSTLSAVVDAKSVPIYNPPKTLLEGKWQEGAEKYLLSLPAPLYQALLNVSEGFESYVSNLIESADKPDFWPTVGRI